MAQLRIAEPRELWRVLDGRRQDGVRLKDKVRGRVGGTRPIRTSEISGTTSYETESATGCGLTLSVVLKGREAISCMRE